MREKKKIFNSIKIFWIILKKNYDNSLAFIKFFKWNFFLKLIYGNNLIKLQPFLR